MQEDVWRPPTGALGRLTAAAYERAARLHGKRAELEHRAGAGGHRPGMAEALQWGPGLAVIGEVKRRSPSRGAINPGLDAVERGTLYATAGARAISVLTEPDEFGGSNDDLLRLATHGSPPLLKKDFHVDAIQLLEARGLGASAALLIVRALPPDRLVELALAALALGVEPLLEVRTERELELALTTPARMIGVNARDLETLEVEVDVVRRLIGWIPADRIAIAESGIATVEDAERVAGWGAQAVLVGSALSQAPDPARLVRALAGVARRA